MSRIWLGRDIPEVSSPTLHTIEHSNILTYIINRSNNVENLQQKLPEAGITLTEGAKAIPALVTPLTPPSLITSSKYRDTVLEMANILRTKSYKYTQYRGWYFNYEDPTLRSVCALGLYYNEKNGDPAAINLGDRIPSSIPVMNDDMGWTFARIADELERGVSIIQ